MRSIFALLFCLAAALAITAGCGGKETGTAPRGEVTGEQESAALETGAKPGEEDVGLPLYPGAESEGTVRWSGSGAEQGNVSQVTLTTSDSFDKVKAFYQRKFPKAETAMEMRTAELQVVQMVVEEGEVTKSIMISREKGEDRTKIVLQRIEEK